MQKVGAELGKDCTITPETAQRIKEVLESGRNAKVTTGKNGVTVYAEAVKKVHEQGDGAGRRADYAACRTGSGA